MFSVRISFISAYPFLPFHFSFLFPFTFLSYLRPFLTHLFSSRLPFSSSPISFHSSCPPLPFFFTLSLFPFSFPRTVALPFCNFQKIGSCKLYYNNVLQMKAKSIFCKLSAIQGGFYAANGRWGARATRRICPTNPLDLPLFRTAQHYSHCIPRTCCGSLRE